MAGISPRILVVDDYALNRLVYAEHLRDLPGVEVLQAATGQRALALAQEHDLALVVIDLSLPDMDGYLLASQLRRIPRAQGTPVILVTTTAGELVQVMRGYRTGAPDFVVANPVHADTLGQRARICVELFRRRGEMEAAAAAAPDVGFAWRVEAFLREREAAPAGDRDPLTGLPTGGLLTDRLQAALARAARQRQRFAVAHVALDEFAAVAERHGRAIADALLVAAAERLTRALRASDTVARLPGARFAVVFEGLDGPSAAHHCGQKVHRMLSQSLFARSESGQVELRTGISIGMATYPDHAGEIDELEVLAELTLDSVQQAGGGTRVYPGVGAGADPGAPETPGGKNAL